MKHLTLVLSLLLLAVGAFLFLSSCSPGAAALPPLVAITDPTQAARGQALAVDYNATVLAGGAVIAQVTADAASQAATAGVALQTAWAGQTAEAGATQYWSAQTSTAAAQASTASAQGTAAFFAAQTSTAAAHQTATAEVWANETAVAQKTRGAFEWKQTTTAGEMQAQGTAVAATATVTAMVAKQNAEHQTALFWTWAPILALVLIVGLAAWIGFNSWRTEQARRRVFEGQDGNLVVLVDPLETRPTRVMLPSRSVGPVVEADPRRALPAYGERAQLQVTAQDQATRAMIETARHGALLGDEEGEGSPGLLPAALTPFAPADEEQLLSVVILPPPGQDLDAGAVPPALDAGVPPLLLEQIEKDWDDDGD